MKKQIAEFMGIIGIVIFFLSWFSFLGQQLDGEFTIGVSLEETVLISLFSALLVCWAVIVSEREEKKQYRQKCKLGV